MKKFYLVINLLFLLTIHSCTFTFSKDQYLQKDGNGNTYLAGYFENSTIKFGDFLFQNNGSRDIFLVKYDLTGKVAWAKNFGSNTNDVIKDFSVDKNGNILLKFLSGKEVNTILLNHNGEVIKKETKTSSSLKKGMSLTKINFPVDGESFQVGTTKEIIWESDNEFLSDIKFEYSTDNGKSWHIITTVPSFLNSFKWIIPNTPSKECKIRYRQITDTLNYDINPGLFSITGKLNWYKQKNGNNVQLNSVHLVNDEKAYAAGYDGIFLTTDGGETWIQQLSGFGLISINFVDENNGYASGLGGSVFKTTDGGIKWKQQYSGTHSTFTEIDFVDPNTGWIAAGNYIYRTTNGGVNWTEYFVTDHVLTSISFINEKEGWAAGNEGVIFNTTDGGLTWKEQLKNGTKINQINSIFFTNEKNGWACGSGLDIEGGIILITTDGGKNWQVILEGMKSSLNSIHFADDKTGWASGRDGAIFKSTDGGFTWQETGTGTSNDLLSVQFINQETGLSVGDNGTIIKYSPNPVVPLAWFTEITASLTDTGIEKYLILGQSSDATDGIDLNIDESPANEISPINFDVRFVLPSEEESINDLRNISENKLSWKIKFQSGYINYPLKFSWNSEGFPEGEFLLKDDKDKVLLNMIENESITITENDTKFLIIEFNSSVTDVSELNIMPVAFNLEQNYPNPFNPATKIRYEIKTQSDVSLKIYDILGNEISTLVNELQAPGIYEVIFDAGELSSGTYIYTLTTGNHDAGQNFSSAKKMILLK